MDPKILLGKMLQRFEDQGFAQVEGYYRFERVRETTSGVIVKRQKGTEAVIPFLKILRGIEFYQENPSWYDSGPSQLREAHILHVTSPVFALLHLLPQEVFAG